MLVAVSAPTLYMLCCMVKRSSQMLHAAGQQRDETSGRAQPTLGEKIKSVIPGTDAHRAKQEHSGYGELLTALSVDLRGRRWRGGGQLLLRTTPPS